MLSAEAARQLLDLYGAVRDLDAELRALVATREGWDIT